MLWAYLSELLFIQLYTYKVELSKKKINLSFFIFVLSCQDCQDSIHIPYLSTYYRDGKY